MSWVKRNLYFLVGSAVAVLLLGLAGYYGYSKWRLNNQNLEKLNEAYRELDKLVLADPNPGNDLTNNIEIARQQEAKVRAAIKKQRAYFVPIPPIPNPTNRIVTKEDYASSLRRTVDELQRAAEAASVTLPPKYNFSFQAQRDLTMFADGSLPPLSVQLGEVRAICRVLFQAKINSLDGLRRERVSGDDAQGPQTDYLDMVSVTNDLAVLTPYEASFHCFSSELAAVLAGFANEPRGYVVKALNVEPASPTPAAGQPGAYGGGFGGPGMLLEGGEYRPPTPAPAPVTRGGLISVLDEKQVKVRLIVMLVKLLPEKTEE
jgi:hypothetical protein